MAEKEEYIIPEGNMHVYTLYWLCTILHQNLAEELNFKAYSYNKMQYK